MKKPQNPPPELPPPPPPPEHLSERSKRLWELLTVERVRDAARQTLLLSALEALDRAEEARLAIQREGLVSTTKTTGAVHVHPLVKVERESKALFAKIWGQLYLNNWTPSEVEKWP